MTQSIPFHHPLSDQPSGAAILDLRPAADSLNLIGLFQAQVDMTPNAIAVGGDFGTLTYAELDDRSDALARMLLAAGARVESAVALLMTHSPEFVISVLAVLKAGSHYVPLRYGNPIARQRTILEETRAILILVDAELRSAAESLDTACIVVDSFFLSRSVATHVPPLDIRPSNLAYVMYTSGSTGTPKAIGITHQGIATFATAEAFRAREHRRVLFHSPVSFDASTYELWVPLLSGGQVTIPAAPFDKSSPEAFRRVIEDLRVTALLLTPALLAVLAEVEPECLAGAKELWFGGEAAPVQTLRRIAHACPDLSLVNAYGPTEETVAATCHRLDRSRPIPDPVPIGRPMTRTETLVLNDRLQPLRPGDVGELYLSGPGLARGYLGRAALTAERFTARPGGRPGERMYRTGDLVRQRMDGLLEYVGRADDMVKISGLRIEPGEIEAVLNHHPAVARAVVCVIETQLGRKQIVAFIQGITAQQLDLAQVRADLSATLPDYMVPTAFVPVLAIPVNAHGKVDRAALAAGMPARPNKIAEKTWHSQQVQDIAGVWCQVLGVDEAGLDDDFFELGGDSLTAMRLAARIRSLCDLELTVKDIYEGRTIAGVSALLDRAPKRAKLRPAPTGRTALTQGQIGLWVSSRLSPGPLYNLPFIVRCPRRLNAEALRLALIDVMRRHAILRTRYPMGDDGSVQAVICDPQVATIPFQTREVRTAPTQTQLTRVARYTFDLEHELPIRAILFQEQDASTLLLLIHHIACDGASMMLLFGDLADAYNARCSGNGPDWLSQPLQFNDHAVFEHDALAEGRYVKHIEFWKQELSTAPDEIAIPADRLRPQTDDSRGDLVSMAFSPKLRLMLADLSSTTGASLLTIMQAGLAGLLTRLGAGTDIPIGAITAGRTQSETEQMVGFFANTLTLRCDTSGDPTFTELLHRSRQTFLAAHAHQDAPFSLVVDALKPPRVRGRHPLFQVAFVMENNPWPRINLDGAAAHIRMGSTGTAKFDLQLEVWDLPSPQGENEEFRCLAEYKTSRFEQKTIYQILGSWDIFLTNAARFPYERISRLSIASMMDTPVTPDC